MAQAVYSKQLWVLDNVTGFITGPSVPAGKVWILRDIMVINFQDQTMPVGPFWVGSTNVRFIFAMGNGRMHGFTPVEWHGRVVLNAGEQLHVSLTGPFWCVYVGGYELTSP